MCPDDNDADFIRTGKSPPRPEEVETLLKGEMPGKSAYALIVGISKYRDERIPNLSYTHADAEAVHSLLTDPECAGFPQDHVKVLLDEEATLFNLKNAVSGWLFQHADPDSTVIVFFAGHGGVESDKTGTERDGMAKYLLPWDAVVDNLFASALSNSEFNWLLSTVKARRLIIFMDACYSGGVSQRGARDIGVMDDPCARLAEGQGRVVIAASQPNQRSWEDHALGHGIFTHHLVEGLKGKADLDEDGYVSVWEVFRHLEREVPRSARRLANSVQEPILCGDISRDIVITADAKRIALISAKASEEQQKHDQQMKSQRARLFDLFNDGKLPLDVYQEALALIEKSPEDMLPVESDLSEFLQALLREALSPERYVRTRNMLRATPETPKAAKLIDKPDASPPIPVARPIPIKFCIHCGFQINPSNKFCNGCGRRVSE